MSYCQLVYSDELHQWLQILQVLSLQWCNSVQILQILKNAAK